ncbi:MAG: DinB family protein [Bryobacteraceae bacterium]
MIRVPDPAEYAPFYKTYISLVPAGNLLTILDDQCEKTRFLLANVDEGDADNRYGPDKWSVKEVVGHIIDTERIMAYRALRVSRNDTTPLPGFEQDDFVRSGPYANCELTSLLEEFHCVRRSTILMFSHMLPEAFDRGGTVDNKRITVRALAHIIAGHEIHHRQILRERYLGR